MSELQIGILSIVAPLIVIILLLCEPQEKRPQTLGRILAVGAIGLAFHNFGPAILGLLILGVSSIREHLYGWAITFWITVGTTLTAVVARMMWLDAKDNRAIRAGSKEAFDRRVTTYIDIFNYSPEKAVEAAMRIRDGEKK